MHSKSKLLVADADDGEGAEAIQACPPSTRWAHDGSSCVSLRLLIAFAVVICIILYNSLSVSTALDSGPQRNSSSPTPDPSYRFALLRALQVDKWPLNFLPFFRTVWVKCSLLSVVLGPLAICYSSSPDVPTTIKTFGPIFLGVVALLGVIAIWTSIMRMVDCSFEVSTNRAPHDNVQRCGQDAVGFLGFMFGTVISVPFLMATNCGAFLGLEDISKSALDIVLVPVWVAAIDAASAFFFLAILRFDESVCFALAAVIFIMIYRMPQRVKTVDSVYAGLSTAASSLVPWIGYIFFSAVAGFAQLNW